MVKSTLILYNMHGISGWLRRVPRLALSYWGEEMPKTKQDRIDELEESLGRLRRERERVETSDRMIPALKTRRLGQLDTEIASKSAELSRLNTR
jgi:hypothetical protein